MLYENERRAISAMWFLAIIGAFAYIHEAATPNEIVVSFFAGSVLALWKWRLTRPLQGNGESSEVYEWYDVWLHRFSRIIILVFLSSVAYLAITLSLNGGVVAVVVLASAYGFEAIVAPYLDEITRYSK
jgi:hypothetical protein